MTAGSLLIALGFNLFLIPHQLLSGGISGISMVIGYITGGNIGLLYFILNLPVLLWGWFAVGHRFIMWSIYTVILSTLFLQIIPVTQIAEDIVLGSVFGGILVGFGSGLTLALRRLVRRLRYYCVHRYPKTRFAGGNDYFHIKWRRHCFARYVYPKLGFGSLLALVHFFRRQSSRSYPCKAY